MIYPKILEKLLKRSKTRPAIEEVGVVARIGDGIAWIYGLSKCGYSEMIEIESSSGQKVTAFALNLGEDEIGAVLLGSELDIKAGDTARLVGKVLEVPVGPELIGRVVDPLGNPLDGGEPIKAKQYSRVERTSSGRSRPKSVHEPMMTGLIAIDAMVPIGRGQTRVNYW